MRRAAAQDVPLPGDYLGDSTVPWMERFDVLGRMLYTDMKKLYVLWFCPPDGVTFWSMNSHLVSMPQVLLLLHLCPHFLMDQPASLLFFPWAFSYYGIEKVPPVLPWVTSLSRTLWQIHYSACNTAVSSPLPPSSHLDPCLAYLVVHKSPCTSPLLSSVCLVWHDEAPGQSRCHLRKLFTFFLRSLQ